MNKPQLHPLRNQGSLAFDDDVKQGNVGVFSLPGLRIMMLDDIIGQALDTIHIVASKKMLERTNAYKA